MQNARPPVDIDRRTFEFALRVVKLCSLLTDGSGVARTIGYQLVKCGTTIGAILEEAHAAHDKQEFAYKMGFALKEARLTNYWLRLLAESKLYADEQLAALLNESTEIMKVIGAITANTRRSLS